MTENIDPRENNKDNYQTGTQVEVTLMGETKTGFVAKQLDERHFLVKLDIPFNLANRKVDGRQSHWLKVSRDYAHQSVKEIS